MDDGSQDDAATLAALERLPVVMEALSEPGGELNRALHEEHAALARLAGMDEQEQAAKIGLVESLPCGEDVWRPLLEEVRSQANVESADDVQKLLALHELSVDGYLSIPLLAGRARLIIELWSRLHPAPAAEEEEGDAEESAAPAELIKSDEVRALLTEALVREVLLDCVLRANEHIVQSHEVWNLSADWELSLLKTVHSSDVAAQLPHIHKLFLDRLRTPHAAADDTFARYTAFVSKYAEDNYEGLLVEASKTKGEGQTKYNKRERWENQLVGEPQTRLAVYPEYIAWELKPKVPDVIRVQAVYARAIADAALVGDLTALETFWLSYLAYLNKNLRLENMLLRQAARAVKSCPMSGELWAWYIRSSERFIKPTEVIDEIYRSALGSQQLTLRDGGVEDLVKVVLARLSYERRRFEEKEVDDDSFVDLALEAVETVKLTVQGGDPSFRAEKYLISFFERAGREEEAAAIWESLTKTHATSYLVWTGWGDFEIRRPAIPRARTVYHSALKKPASLDWPEAVFSAFLAFEEMYGDLDSLDEARALLEKAQGIVTAKRTKDAAIAAKAAERSQQYDAAQAQAAAPALEASAMDVDTSPSTAESSAAGLKRKADEELAEGDAKKPKPDAPAPAAPSSSAPLVRDRENTTVFVSNLIAGTTEDDLRALFKDCGLIREVKVTSSPERTVATVEFFARDSIPAAQTKDKKLVNGAEVEVSLAWQSTLYVTNFPEAADDAYIRALFEPYGVIHETRWPGKKFKGSRRFVYVQFLSPNSAKNALELDKKELEPQRILSVAISNPQRKKERTDAHASSKEVVVSQMSKFVQKADLERLFRPFGEIKDIRMNLDEEGHVRGAAFIEFTEEAHATAALSMNSYELKKRRIAVTIPDHRAKAAAKLALEKCVRVGGLPKGTQEALLQQAFEKISPVNRVSVTERFNEALVELESEEAVGKVLLSHTSLSFDGVLLPLLSGTQRFSQKATAQPAGTSSSAGTTTATDFTPSTLLRPAPRPKSTKGRLGLGAERKRPATFAAPGTTFVKAAGGPGAGAIAGDVEMSSGGGEGAAGDGSSVPAAAAGKKGQDAFRAMLLEKK